MSEVMDGISAVFQKVDTFCNNLGHGWTPEGFGKLIRLLFDETTTVKKLDWFSLSAEDMYHQEVQDICHFLTLERPTCPIEEVNLHLDRNGEPDYYDLPLFPFLPYMCRLNTLKISAPQDGFSMDWDIVREVVATTDGQLTTLQVEMSKWSQTTCSIPSVLSVLEASRNSPTLKSIVILFPPVAPTEVTHHRNTYPLHECMVDILKDHNTILTKVIIRPHKFTNNVDKTIELLCHLNRFGRREIKSTSCSLHEMVEFLIKVGLAKESSFLPFKPPAKYERFHAVYTNQPELTGSEKDQWCSCMRLGVLYGLLRETPDLWCNPNNGGGTALATTTTTTVTATATATGKRKRKRSD